MVFLRLIEPACHRMVCVTRAREATASSEVGLSSSASINIYFTFIITLLFLQYTVSAIYSVLWVLQSVNRHGTTWCRYFWVFSICRICQRQGASEAVWDRPSLPLLKPDMAIMADKGFLVDNCVPCKIYRPTYLSKRKRM